MNPSCQSSHNVHAQTAVAHSSPKHGRAWQGHSFSRVKSDRRRNVDRWSVVFCLCLLCGCTVFDLKKRIPWMDTDQITAPTKITTLWTHTILNQTGKKGVRGFGGRIMFHGKDNEKPVRVEGTMIVYAFDETNRVSSVPERKFVFTPEQFDKHYSQSKLGHSYSIWLPWDEVGGAPRKINLLARFEPVEGGMVMSEHSLQILPGIEPLPYDDATSQESDGEVMQAGHQSSSNKEEKSELPIRKPAADPDTIDLPPGFIRRLGPQDELFPVKIQRERSTSTGTIFQNNAPAAAETQQDKEQPRSNGSNGTSQDQSSVRSTNPHQALVERQRELSDHFGRRKYQVQRASSARSILAPPQNQPPLVNEPSLLPQSSTPGASDRVE